MGDAERPRRDPAEESKEIDEALRQHRYPFDEASGRGLSNLVGEMESAEREDGVIRRNAETPEEVEAGRRLEILEAVTEAEAIVIRERERRRVSRQVRAAEWDPA